MYGSKGKYKHYVDGFPKGTFNNRPHKDNGDNYEFTYNISEDLLSVGTYNGNYSIGIKQGNGTIKNRLNLPIKVNVKSGIEESKIDYCKTQDGDVTIYLEPCNIDVIFDKLNGNKAFNYRVKSTNGEIYSVWKGWYDGLPKHSIGSRGAYGSYFDEKQFSKGTYSGTQYIVVQNNQGIKLRELRLPIKVTVEDTPGEIDYCSTIIDGVTYTLSPCEINKSITKRSGTHDTPVDDFTFKVISSSNSNNEIIVGGSKKVGLPRMSIGGKAGGRGIKEVEIKNYIYDQYLEKGKYNGYVEFHINNEFYLKKIILKVNLDVK